MDRHAIPKLTAQRVLHQRCFIDTGSDISIVNPDIVQMEALQPVSPCFRTVMGRPDRGHQLKEGATSLSTEVSQPLWVADIQDPCILGSDFLEPLRCLDPLAKCS